MRGVEAPFQLVVSVVTILFVLYLSYMVISNAIREDCSKKIDIQLRNIATTVSTAVYSSPPTKLMERFDFRCGGMVGDYYVSVKGSSNETECLRVCGYSYSGQCVYLILEVRRGEEVLNRSYACIEGAVPSHNITINGGKDKVKVSPPYGSVEIEKTEDGITLRWNRR